MPTPRPLFRLAAVGLLGGGRLAPRRRNTPPPPPGGIAVLARAVPVLPVTPLLGRQLRARAPRDAPNQITQQPTKKRTKRRRRKGILSQGM